MTRWLFWTSTVRANYGAGVWNAWLPTSSTKLPQPVPQHTEYQFG